MGNANCATNCCAGKDGEAGEFNMAGQSEQLQKLGWQADEGAYGLDG